MGNISKNFDRKEFACSLCCGKDNINMKLVETVQAIRDTIGAPVVINSGVRCADKNKEVGGVPNSSHMAGLAADIYVAGWSNAKLGALIKQLHSVGKLPHLKYCYKISGKTNTAVHVDVDGIKTRSKVFGF